MSNRKIQPVFRPPDSRIQSIARARAILDVLSRREGDWVSLRDIAEGTGLLKPTAFNLVTALVEVRLAEHNPALGAYRLGIELMGYGRTVERRIDLLGFMQPYLVRLCAATRETVNLALPCPESVLIVGSLEGSQSLRVTSYVGTRAPYHSTACGRALLAFGPASLRRHMQVPQLDALTPRTTTNPARLEAILALCRLRGFVEEIEENEIDAACVGAPFLDVGGEAIAAVSIAGPLTRMDPPTRERLGALLVETLAEARGRLFERAGEGAGP